MVRRRARTRFLLLGISLAVLVLTSWRMGFWSDDGVSVQVFDPNAKLFGSQGVLVCAPPGVWGIPDDGPADLTLLHIVAETLILDQRDSSSPTPGRYMDLRRGQRLRVWTGHAVFSYPSQVSVERLVIEDDGQPESLDCQWRGGLRVSPPAPQLPVLPNAK